MSGLTIVRPSERDANTAQTSGMVREAGIGETTAGAQTLWFGYVKTPPCVVAGAHHHGDCESAISMLSGRARFRWGPQLEHEAEVGPGDFLFVPPNEAHAEENLSDTEPFEMLVARGCTGIVVVNVPDPRVEAHGQVHARTGEHSQGRRHHMARLVGILGSVTPPGRLLHALEWALQAARDLDQRPTVELLNLADYRIGFADGRSLEQLDDDTAAVVRTIAEADAVVFASPVYRASFTGAMKNLLDLVPVEALAGKPCGIVAMGAMPDHYLGVDWGLRTVLSWFGAVVAPTSVYLSSADFAAGQPSDGARSDLLALVGAVLTLERSLAGAGAQLGPPPLAMGRGSRKR
ncbi:MAG: NAD(P)H-dependent oxidoreductase [Chloroflexi bacterium]|nr:NAD(P)H-dependent oxidoreductase [Chloroflexota bacterium]